MPDPALAAPQSLEQTVASVATSIGKASGYEIEHADARVFTERAVIVRAATGCFVAAYQQLIARDPSPTPPAGDVAVIIAAAEQFAARLKAAGHLV